MGMSSAAVVLKIKLMGYFFRFAKKSDPKSKNEEMKTLFQYNILWPVAWFSYTMS